MARSTGIVLGVVIALTAALGPGSVAAGAAAPATVRVAVEGATATLLPPTTLTTRETAVERSGASCPGTSAGGALEVASAGAWTAGFDPAAGLLVESILGESHVTPADPRRFVLFVNSVVVKVSPCALELNPGDTVLFFAGSTPASALAPDCRTNGRDGLCGSPDRSGPVALISSLREQQVFSVRRAPLTIAGRVLADPSGLGDVRLRITRTRGRHCHYYSGIEETFLRARRCGATGPQFFSIGEIGPTWSYLLPRRLTRGRYTVDVLAVDGAGNASAVGARGRDRIVVFVR